jgi:O-antigen/teichoic acid export membrane protein
MSEDTVSANARGGVRSLIFRVLSAACDFLVVFVTTRGFGAEGRGLYALTSLAVTSTGMLLGGPSVVMRSEIGRKRVPLGRLFAASLVLSAGVLALSLVVAPGVAAAWPAGSAVVLYVAVAIAPMILMEMQISLYQALGDVRRMHYVWLARSVVPLVALAVMAIVAPGHIHLALLVWACVQFIVPAFTLRVQRRQARLDFHRLRPLLARLVRRGIPVSVANGVAKMTYRLDLIVVAVLLTVADVGRYSVAIAAGESLLLLSRAALTGAYAPMISSGLEESIRVTVRTMRHCIALVLPAGVALTLLARVLFEPVFGPDFADVWELVGLLVPAFLAVGLTELLAHFLLVRLERTRELLIACIVTAIANLAGAAVLVTAIGLPGAAISSSVFYCLGVVYLVARLTRSGAPASPRAYLPGAAELSDYVRLLGAVRRRLPGAHATR